MKFILFLLLFLSLMGQALAVVPQDIVLKSRFDLDSSQNFVNQLRIILGNNNFGDPYRQGLIKPVVVDLNEVLESIPESTQRWITDLQSLLRVKFFGSSLKLVVEKFGYEIQDFSSEFRPGVSIEKRVEFVSVNYIRGLHLSADKIYFEVELKQAQNGAPIKFRIDLVGPEFLINEGIHAELPMGWTAAIEPENMFVTLESIDIRKVMEVLSAKPELVDLQLQDLIMPELSIRVGQKEIKFDHEKIKTFFASRRNEMKKGILDILNFRMGNRFSNILQGRSQKLTLQNTYYFNTSIAGQLKAQEIGMNNSGIMEFGIHGHYCKRSDLAEGEKCNEKKIVTRMRRQITQAQYQKSLRELNRSIIENNNTMALSISEDYINQLIEATAHEGLWSEAFEGKDFSLGPEKAFILADETGKEFSLYLDIIYKLRGAERIFVGKSELRFPVKMMIDLNITEIGGLPHIVIKVKRLATDNKLLLEGMPHYGIPSNVGVSRFQGRILKEISTRIQDFDNKVLVDIEMKEIKGTYLNELEFFSDGMGRATAVMAFKK